MWTSGNLDGGNPGTSSLKVCSYCVGGNCPCGRG